MMILQSSPVTPITLTQYEKWIRSTQEAHIIREYAVSNGMGIEDVISECIKSFPPKRFTVKSWDDVETLIIQTIMKKSAEWDWNWAELITSIRRGCIGIN